jgi:putative ABC transport system permease protein
VSVLDRKLKRDLVLSKGMLAAIIAIIAVGSGCLVGMLGTFWNLKSAQISYYSNCRMADFWLDLKKAPVSSVRELQKLKGVSEIRNRIAFPVIVDLENVEKPISGKVITLPDERLPVINGIVLKRGSYFTDGQRDEVIVSEKFAEARNINPGDFIHIVLKGQRKKLFVVGSAISSEFMYLTPPGSIAPDPAGYGVFWIKREYAEDVLGFHGACNNLVGLLTPEAKLDPEPVLNEISERLNSYGVFTATPLAQQESNLSLCSEMAGLQTQATVLPVIFLGVAALALNVVMLRMAEQQRTIIGTLKALGVSNRKILRMR